MKARIISFLKILIPISFGGFIIWAFYDAMCDKQKEEMFDAFESANYFWLIFFSGFGLASHMSRAWRWRYLLEPLGSKPGFWPSYHAVMSGYLINYIFPRAGEASRAAIMSRRTGMPFEKVFGTIVAERAIDLVMLALIGALTLMLQLENLDLFQAQIKAFQTGSDSCGSSPILTWMGRIVTYIIIAGFVGAIVLGIVKASFRKKLLTLITGTWSGVTSIFKSKYKGPFILHTLLIWLCYVLFFAVCFPALDTTADIGIDGMLAGFIAGSLGIVLVQGGIGVYPAFVGLILTTFIDGEYGLGIHPQGLALGWLIWTCQTLMMIVLGLISLIYVGRIPKPDDNTGSDNT